MASHLPALYLISDRGLCPNFVEVFAAIASASPRGAVAFQVREKDLSPRELYSLTTALVARVHSLGAMVFVNDRSDVALAANADGVHLSGRSMWAKDAKRLGLWVAASTHDQGEIERAEGADFCTFGPIYDTPSKREMGSPVGTRALARCASLNKKMPLYALGGVTLERVRELMQSGARGVAVIGAVLSSPEPVRAAMLLIDAAIGGAGTW